MNPMPTTETRAAYRHFLAIPTRWMDNDIYGHVNNVVYYSYFDTVVGCDEVPRSKPAPDGILKACERLGVAPSETIMIGDSRFDEGAAKAAGTGFRWFTSYAELKI